MEAQLWTLIGILIYANVRLWRLANRIDALTAHSKTRFDALDARFDSVFDSQTTRYDGDSARN